MSFSNKECGRSWSLYFCQWLGRIKRSTKPVRTATAECQL